MDVRNHFWFARISWHPYDGFGGSANKWAQNQRFYKWRGDSFVSNGISAGNLPPPQLHSKEGSWKNGETIFLYLLPWQVWNSKVGEETVNPPLSCPLPSSSFFFLNYCCIYAARPVFHSREYNRVMLFTSTLPPNVLYFHQSLDFLQYELKYNIPQYQF